MTVVHMSWPWAAAWGTWTGSLNGPRPDVGDAKRGYADEKGLDGGGSAGIRRRQRSERDGIR